MNPTYQHYATHDESDFPHLWRGVVGAWAPCLGPSGLRLHDHSGRANWGTLTNMDPATDWVVDSGQYALDFDLTNDYLQLSTPISLDGDFFFSGWIYSTSTSNRVIWTNSVGGLTTFFLNTASTISFRTQSSSLVTFASSLASARWANIVLTRRSSSVRLFVDGIESTSGPLSAAGTVTVDRIGISFALGFPFAGMIDDFLFSSTSASENIISEFMQIGRGGIYTPRRRRRAYSFGPSFQAAWARGSNVILQPCGVS